MITETRAGSVPRTSSETRKSCFNWLCIVVGNMVALMVNWSDMKIAYITPYEGEREIVTNLLSDHEVVFHDQLIDKEVPAELADADAISIFVNSKLTEEMVDSMPNLKVIALRSMGYDHVPVAYAQSKGIKVAYVPRYGAQTVAEHAFTLMLCLSRKVPEMYELLRRVGNIDIAGHEGFDLCCKTLGVIGTGSIGKRACEIGRGFRMNVKAYDLYPDEDFASKYGIEYESFDDVLGSSDIITLHVPATPENHHLLNEQSLGKVKAGAYIINTARGVLIDTVALLRSLKSGHIAGAGLDVFEGEEYLKDEMKLLDPEAKIEIDVFRAFAAQHEFLDMSNVIMTPHMAFNTIEAKLEITETTVKNILTAFDGEPDFPVKL